ncbi:MAG: 3'-5' exonuclease [Deltaproteobacteria bacterium]|nr:3'-5' exonuclease [Deltaproteobacteria bacterium]
MRLKLERPLVMFDVETTGLDAATDRIVELAAVKLWPDGRVEEKCRRFNPLVPIPKEATAVHGIRDEDVKDEPPFLKVAHGDKGVAAFFAGCDLAGYNVADYDIPILKAELERAGERLDLSDAAVVDAYKIFVGREPRHLTAALRFYCGKEHDKAHSAMGDVRATLEVLAAELERYPDLPDTPAAIDKSMRNPEHVDRRGKLRWQDGEIAVAFGRHKGRTLKYLASEEPDYIRWMIDSGVAPDAEKILHDALIGAFEQKDGGNS